MSPASGAGSMRCALRMKANVRWSPAWTRPACNRWPRAGRSSGEGEQRAVACRLEGRYAIRGRTVGTGASCALLLPVRTRGEESLDAVERHLRLVRFRERRLCLRTIRPHRRRGRGYPPSAVGPSRRPAHAFRQPRAGPRPN